MSPMPTPEYEEYLSILVRKAQREGKLRHHAPPDRRSAARDRNSGPLPDSRLLDTPITDPELRAEVMRAHRAWAKKHAPWLLEEWLDD